ncbi:MAG: acyltransferase family protein [Clostridia bacterium]|nr:acyltransferase family protein [Clostridia bacterium]
MPSQRVSQWDNAKAILMLLVVGGHLLEPLTAEGYPLIYRSIFLFLYTFHMPAFIFISGLFSKNTLGKGEFPIRKLLPFVVLSFLLKAFYLCIDTIRNKDFMPNSIFQLSNIAWFLFALFIFYCMMYLLKSLKGKYVLLFAMVFACMAGYNGRLGDFFAVGRIFVFFPFFALGYYTDRERLQAFLAKKKVKIAAAAVLVLFAAAVIIFVNPLYTFRPLLTGRNPYQELGNTLYYWGGLLRLVYYGVSTAVMLAVLALIPRRAVKLFTFIGQNTLSIYFWHLPLVEALYLLGIPAWVERYRFAPVVILAAAAASVALCALLSLPPFKTFVNFVKGMFQKYDREPAKH